jgi:hypothetical protein
MPPDYCPNCGAAVPAQAVACPECGADEDTGWSDDAYAHRLGLPEEDFDYDEFVERELGEPDRPTLKPQGLHWFWWLVALGLVIAMLSFWF